MSKNDLRNAKQEFLNVTKNYKVIAAKFSFDKDYSWKEEETNVFELKPLYKEEDYNKLLEFLDRKYDSGYGGQNLFGTIYCEDGVWIDRGEYDGSEWYNVHKYPSLRDSFDEIDVLKYERSKKIQKINEIL